MIPLIDMIYLIILSLLPLGNSTRCYRRYASLIFKPIEFWQERGKFDQLVFRINEFYDFPHGFFHKEYQWDYTELCWRGKRFITDFQLHPYVPQIDRDEWYDGCQVQLRQEVFMLQEF